ncbi:MAG: hypothetical protein AABY04_02430 [Candidatus Micrarchaeota archaeon]
MQKTASANKKKFQNKDIQSAKKSNKLHPGFKSASNPENFMQQKHSGHKPAYSSTSEKPLDAFHRHEFEPKIPHPDHPFHPYKKKSIYGRISESFRLHGLPEPKLFLALMLVLAGALLAFSVLLPIINGPTKADLLIAIQDSNGNIIKDAALTLISTNNGAKYSSKTQMDGTAPFSQLLIGENFEVRVEKDGGKILLEDSNLKIPAVRRGRELVIVLRAQN